jgi:hypothetical protein
MEKFNLYCLTVMMTFFMLGKVGKFPIFICCFRYLVKIFMNKCDGCFRYQNVVIEIIVILLNIKCCVEGNR